MHNRAHVQAAAQKRQDVSRDPVHTLARAQGSEERLEYGLTVASKIYLGLADACASENLMRIQEWYALSDNIIYAH